MSNRVFTLLENETADIVSDPFALDSGQFTVYVTGQLDGGVITLETSPDNTDWYPLVGGIFSATKKNQPVDYVSTFDDNVIFLRARLDGAGVAAGATVKAVIKVI